MKIYTQRICDRNPGVIWDNQANALASNSTRLDEDSILYIIDTFSDSDLSWLLKKYGNPKYIVSDSHSFFSSKHYPRIYTVDIFLKWLAEGFEKKGKLHLSDELITKYSANFMVNKKQLNRYLTIKLCEIFGIDYDYTWSGIGREFDCSKIVDEKNNLNDSIIDNYWDKILMPINITKKWIPVTRADTVGNDVNIADYGNNFQSWNQGLNKMFQSSAVSLISECIQADFAMTWSEKTYYAIIGLTFPIWVGGYKQQLQFKKLGFDTFEDIIDHSYQYKSTFLERCFYAVYLNLELLKDKPRLDKTRQSCYTRLINNRKKLNSLYLGDYYDKVIATWPKQLQDEISKTDMLTQNYLGLTGDLSAGCG